MEVDSVSNDKEYSMENNNVKSTKFEVQDVSINLDSNENIDGSAVMVINEKQMLPNITFIGGNHGVENKHCLPDNLE